MPISSNKITKVRGTLMVVVVVCIFLGGVAYWYTDGFSFPEPAPQPPPKTAMAKQNNAKKEMPKATPSVTSDEFGTSGTPVLALNTDAGNVLAYAQKQAKLEEVKLDVAIAEQQAKLDELKNGKPVPVIRPVPQPVAVLPSELPPLPPLATPPQGELPTLPSGPLPRSRRTSGLVAVQGVDGSLSAVFATGTGKKNVRVGDAVMGSKVRSISLDGVTLASGKTITIED